jgi:putative ABC transport system permease protein
MLTRLPWRSLQRHRGRALVTALGVLAGVAGLRAMELGTTGAFASVRAAYESEAGPAALTAVPAGDAAGALSANTLDVLEHAPEVAAVLPAVRIPAEPTAELERWRPPLLPGEVSGLLVLGVDLGREHGHERFRLTAGSDRGEGWLLGEDWAAERGLHPGSTLELESSAGSIRVRVGGLLAREGLGATNVGRVAIANLAEVRRIFELEPSEVHEASLVLRQHVNAEDARRRLESLLAPGVSLVQPAERGKDVVQRLKNVTAATELISTFALFLSGFLIYGLFATNAAERRRDLGLLRCSGATRMQAAFVLLAEAALLAVPGAVGGAALGSLLATGVTRGIAPLAGVELHLPGADLGGAVRAAAQGIAVALLAAAWPAVRAAQEPPFDSVRARSSAARPPSRLATLVAGALVATAAVLLAARPPGVASQARTYSLVLLLLAGCVGLAPAVIAPVARLAGGALRFAGPAVTLGAAAPRWRPRRSGIAAGMVLACTAMAGGVAALSLGWRAEMAAWADRSLRWDLFVRHPSGLGPRAVERLLHHPGVRRGTPALVRRAEVLTSDGRRIPIAVAGLDAEACAVEDTFLFAPGTAGEPGTLTRSLGDGASAFVTSVVAEQLAVRPGEVVTVLTPTGPRRLHVRAEITDYTLNGFVLVVSDAFVRDAFGALRAELVALRLEPGVDAGAFAASLEPGLRVERRDALKARVRAVVDASLGALDALLWLCGVIGLLAVGTAVAQGSIERYADLAVLRSLGLDRGGVVGMLCAEAALTAAVGAVGGVAVGLLLGWIFTEASRRLGVPVPFIPPWRALSLTALAAVALALPLALLPARRALRIPPAEALQGADL